MDPISETHMGSKCPVQNTQSKLFSPCVKQNGKNTSFSMSHIFGKKRTIPNLFILAYYSLSSTVSILFNLMLRLYIYTG